MIHIIVIGKQQSMLEFCDSIQLALLSKGYESKVFYYNWYEKKKKIKDDINFSNEFNIVINLQHADEHIILPKNKSIKVLILPEQNIIGVRHKKWDRVITLFKPLSTKDIIYMPIGFSDSFNNPKCKIGNGYDIFSFGSLTPYRKKIVDKLSATHLKEGVWGDDRDIIIRNSKFNINLKARRKYYFAPIHAMLVICKGITLFQEICDGDYDLYKPYMIQFDTKTFLETQECWIDDDIRKSFGVEARKKLMNTLSFDYEFFKSLKHII